MTLDELNKTLPNGFHDAKLLKLQVDYDVGSAFMDIDLDLSSPDINTGDFPSESHRLARVRFSDVQFVACDVPDSKDCAGPSRIDADTGQPTTAPARLPEISRECFLCWIFVDRWNGFIRIAARSVELEWLADARPVN